MPITITCGQCKQTLSVGEEHAGKRGKCPTCQAILPIPELGSARTAAAAPPIASTASLPARPPAPQAKVAGTKAPAVRQAATGPDQLRAAIMASFRGPIERVPTSPLYQLGILLTALFMVVLPLIYVALIGLVGLAVWWHLANNHVIFGAVHGGRAGLM